MVYKRRIIVMQGDRYSLNQQVMNFNSTLNKYREMMNANALSQYLAKSIVIMVTGNNDYINNYLMPALYRTSFNYTAQEFGNILINSYTQQILVIFLLSSIYLSYLLHLVHIFKSLKLHLDLLYIKLILIMLYCRHYIT